MSRKHSPALPQPASAEAYSLGRWFAAARRQGFLARLSPKAWHTLSGILSFTSRDGHRNFTVDQLALAIGQSREVAHKRLEQLATLDWQEQPLLALEQDGRAIAGATLAPIELFTRIELEEPPGEPGQAVPASDAAAAEPPRNLVAELDAVGLDEGQIDWLTGRFPLERIRRQLDWLPPRQPRNPAGMLIRAIEEDWGPRGEGP